MTLNHSLVLVAEDHPLVRIEAVLALIDHGYEVLEASNGDEALAFLEERGGDIRVLFTDIQMPGSLDGVELAYRTQRRWPWIKLLISSGKARPRPEEMPHGTHFLPKAYDPEEMVREVERLIAAE